MLLHLLMILCKSFEIVLIILLDNSATGHFLPISVLALTNIANIEKKRSFSEPLFLLKAIYIL